MIHELSNVIWLETPRGRAIAMALIDRGPQSDLEWVCFVAETGECWTFLNQDIRVSKNETQGLNVKAPVPPKPWDAEIAALRNENQRLRTELNVENNPIPKGRRPRRHS